MQRAVIIFLATIFLSVNGISADTDTISELYEIAVTVKKCLSNKHPVVCLKEKALDALNETVFTDEPIIIGYIRIEKNDEYDWNKTRDSALPNEITKRSLLLNDALYEKLQDFFKSRTIRFNIDEAVEGRKKGGGGGKGGGKGMMMAAAACVGAGMMVGKMGMMAMAAMMMSKLSLLLSAIMMLKKSKGGGGDESKEKQIKIIYATTSGGGGDYGKGGGGGGGGGGWHRSLNHEPQTITYRAHIPSDANANVVYEGY
ncbi:unnamed protein product [Ceutorhynchus assimilis]|uniref:Uncharacterized protein n=1 Tax=Ceutorhynchus assimilis TaxID=467358 RepID=A0A9N9QJY6_9CUCU|nr:unnamed protein product [Ceutorhynchus assimilis]